MTLKERFSTAKEIVLEAGEILISNNNQQVSRTEKDEFNYVTKIDLEINSYIINRIKSEFPDSHFISEELKDHSIDQNKRNGSWILDPIDGTTNYIHNYPHYAISLAYVENNKVIFALIYNPIASELYTAIKGEGAFLNGKRIRVSASEHLNRSIVGVGFPYDREVAIGIFDIMKSLYKNCEDIKRKGPASIDLAYVASGKLDAYFEPNLKIWDIAAGVLLVEEAGGKVTNWAGESLTLDITQSVVVSNGLIQQELMKYL